MKRPALMLAALVAMGMGVGQAATAHADSVENMHLLHRTMMNERTHPTVMTDLPEAFQTLLGQGDWAAWVALLDSWGMDFNAAYRDLDPADGEVLIIGGTLWEAHRPVLVLRASDYRLLALRYPLAPPPEPPPAPVSEEAPSASDGGDMPEAEPPSEPALEEPAQNAEAPPADDAAPQEAETESQWDWATVTIHYDEQGRADALVPGWWPPAPPQEEAAPTTTGTSTPEIPAQTDEQAP